MGSGDPGELDRLVGGGVSRRRVSGRVRIWLCGGLQVEVDGGRVESRLARRKSRELLAFLVLNDGPVARSRLIESLWPDRPPGSRDTVLRQVLSELRGCLGAEALPGRAEVCLALPEGCWVDTREAQRALDRLGDALEERRFEQARLHAREAIEMLGGELLAGYDADWLVEHRDAVRELEVGAVEGLARACSCIPGREGEAVAAARRTVSLAPFRESGYSLLMRALVAEGDPAEALLVYERWRELLRDELGITPSLAMSALHVWALQQAAPEETTPWSGAEQEPLTGYARRADGVSIAYQVLGEGPVDVINVPGFMSHLDMQWANPEWRGWTRAIAAHARAILLDKAGTGASDAVAGIPTVEEWAGDVLAVLDAVGSERAVVLAASESGAIGAHLACAHPGRVRGLILYGAFARWRPAPEYLWEQRDEISTAVERFREVEFSWGRGASFDLFAPTRAASDAARRAWAIFERASGSPAAAAQRIAALEALDAREDLPRIAVPTLVVHRAGDRVVPAHHGRYPARSPARGMWSSPGRTTFRRPPRCRRSSRRSPPSCPTPR